MLNHSQEEPQNDIYFRFTDRSRRVMKLAEELARELNHSEIGTEHILLGLSSEGEGVAGSVLKFRGVDLQRLKLEATKFVPASPEKSLTEPLPLSHSAVSALSTALEEARRLDHNYVGTEHLLLCLIRNPDNVASRVLVSLGLRLEDVHYEVLSLLGHMVHPILRTPAD